MKTIAVIKTTGSTTYRISDLLFSMRNYLSNSSYEKLLKKFGKVIPNPQYFEDDYIMPEDLPSKTEEGKPLP